MYGIYVFICNLTEMDLQQNAVTAELHTNKDNMQYD